jgi:hypothetical protein
MNKMKLILLVLIVNCIGFKARAQYLVLDDSLKIDFLENDGKVRIVNSPNDLNYGIIVMNMSKKVVKSYVQLIYDDTSSPFGNYYWELYKKNDSDYVFLPRPKQSSAAGYVYDELNMTFNDQIKTDSAFAIYDLPKKNLVPFQCDTLQFNFLMGSQFIDPGDYGMRIFFRVGDFYAIHKNLRRSIGRNYVNSDMYYFKITKRLVIDINKLPK